MAKVMKPVEADVLMALLSDDEHDHDDGHDSGGGHDGGHDHDPTPVYGTNQSDLIIERGGPQTIITGNGSDTVHAGGGPDVVELGNGKDRADGEGGPDTIFGANGKDEIVGSCGPDELFGGNGKDILIGGKGPDEMTGGRGADIFRYVERQDAPGGGHDEGSDDGHTDHEEGGHTGGGGGGGGHDSGGCADGRLERITDFEPGLDQIDLHLLGRLVFGQTDGGDDYDGTVNVVEAGEFGGARVVISFDHDAPGTGPREMSILLDDVASVEVTAADFIL